MAFFLYDYLRQKWGKKGETTAAHKEAKQRNSCEHRLQTDQTSSTPPALSTSAVIQQNDENDIGDDSPLQQIVEKRQITDPISYDPSIPCRVCEEEKKAARRYRWKLIAGLALPFAVQGLDSTIIAGALPFIASDFNELAQLNWIVSSFNLTEAIFIPAWGNFADVFGRYIALQTALVVMIVGNTLCASSPATAFPMLLAGRGLQGIGCAGLMIVTKVILADKVSLKENAKNNTIFTLVGGLGYGVGPSLGGYLTQVSWRWCFILNIPIGIIGVFLAHFVLRPELLGPQEITRTDGDIHAPAVPSTLSAKLSTIDYGGQILFLFGMGMLVLALTWAGDYYSWSDVKVIAPLAIGSCLLVVFLTWEYFLLPGSVVAARYPYLKGMIPLKLLLTRNAGLLIYINFTTGMAMYAVFYVVDLYFALVLNYTPGEAGRNLIFYMLGLGFGAYLAMFACNFYPRQTWSPLALGTVIEPLGITLLAMFLKSGNLPAIFGMIAFTGVGTGIRFMPGTLHGVGYYPTQIASIVSLMSLAINLGGTFATTIMFNIFNNGMRKSGIVFSSSSTSSFDAISSLSPDVRTGLRYQAKSSITVAFFAITAFMWLGMLAIAALGNVNVVAKGGDHVVIKGSFLGSLLRKRGASTKL